MSLDGEVTARSNV